MLKDFLFREKSVASTPEKAFFQNRQNGHLGSLKNLPIRFFVALCLCAVVQAQNPRQVPSHTNQRELSSREIIQKVSQSLVSILTQDKEGQPLAQASGFFFKEGLIVTNLHVFKRASQAYVKLLSSGLTYKVDRIAGINRKHDLCVFRIKGGSAPALPMNSTGRIGVGDDIYTAGSPIGLEGTFSKGIISSIRLDQGLIQIDAAISPGSSGGPGVNNRGEVIRIVVSSLSGGENLNFAIPIRFLEATAQDKNGDIEVAGALSLTDRDKERLKGPVRRAF
ncbi:MAG: S1C family serine protease [Blastocatellia bacterium]